MPLPQSRSQNVGFESRSASRPAKVLLRALNDELGPSVRGKREVVDPRALLLLVKRFQQLEDAIAMAGKAKVIEGSPYETPEVLKRYRAVNRLMHRYKATPGIFPNFMFGDETSKGWDFSWGRVGSHIQPFMEVGFVQQIERIAASGKIKALKQCEQCRKWLFARFPHQRFCSSKCKETFHRTDPIDRERRRAWAKENYKIHKTKNVK